MVWAVDGLLDYQMGRQKDHFRCLVHLEAVRLAMERVRDSIYRSQNHQWTSDHNHLRNGFENSVKCHSETSFRDHFGISKVVLIFEADSGHLVALEILNPCKAWFGTSQ